MSTGGSVGDVELLSPVVEFVPGESVLFEDVALSSGAKVGATVVVVALSVD